MMSWLRSTSWRLMNLGTAARTRSVDTDSLNTSFAKHVPSILIVEENLLTRLGLRQILLDQYPGLTFGEAKSSDEAVIRLIRQSWDLVVLGLSIFEKNGFYILQEVRNRHPSTRVLVLSTLSTQADSKYSVLAEKWGATGCVGKNASRADLIRAFRNVFAGKKHFGNFTSRSNAVENRKRHGGLSAREYGVLLGYVAGKRASQIALDLDLSVKTVSTYKRRILDKLGLDSTADLIRYAIDHHLS